MTLSDALNARTPGKPFVRRPSMREGWKVAAGLSGYRWTIDPSSGRNAPWTPDRFDLRALDWEICK